jgi:hypothetical protein
MNGARSKEGGLVSEEGPAHPFNGGAAPCFAIPVNVAQRYSGGARVVTPGAAGGDPSCGGQRL